MNHRVSPLFTFLNHCKAKVLAILFVILGFLSCIKTFYRRTQFEAWYLRCVFSIPTLVFVFVFYLGSWPVCLLCRALFWVLSKATLIDYNLQTTKHTICLFLKINYVITDYEKRFVLFCIVFFGYFDFNII